MPYFTDGEEVGFARRRGGGGGGGGGMPRSMRSKRDRDYSYDDESSGEVEGEEPTGAEEIVGEEIGADGTEYDVVEAEYEVVALEVDGTGAPTGRKRRTGKKRLKTILRARAKARRDWASRDKRFDRHQRSAERSLGQRHIPPSWEDQDGDGRTDSMQRGGRAAPNPNTCGGVAPGRRIAKPLVTATTLATTVSGTLTLTPQYQMEIDKFVMTATLSLPPVIISNILFGVEPLYANPEGTTGWGADAFAPNGMLGDFMKGKMLVPQTPIKISLTNGHTATQTISAFLKGETTIASYASSAA